MKKSPSLLVKIVIAILLGVACSFFFPLWATRIFVTVNSIFGNFLGMFIPLLIIGLIAPGIAELGKDAGKLLLITVAIAYGSTILCGFFSYGCGRLLFPPLLGDSMSALGDAAKADEIAPYFTIEMPAFINVMTALVLAFMLGLSLSFIDGRVLKDGLMEFKHVILLVIEKVIIPFLPFYIFGIFLKMGAEGAAFAVLGTFVKLILIIFVMHVTVLVIQFIIGGSIAGKNPFKALWTMLPAYATALGTMSSAATIPVTLKQTKLNGVDEDVANFVIPLCATIHMSCSILKITACALVISMSLGMPYDFGTYAGFVMMLGIAAVAAPGVPGGAVMASLGLLGSMLGFDSGMQGLVIALYVAMDSFGTAGNVTGDGAIALIINKIKNKVPVTSTNTIQQ